MKNPNTKAPEEVRKFLSMIGKKGGDKTKASQPKDYYKQLNKKRLAKK